MIFMKSHILFGCVLRTLTVMHGSGNVLIQETILMHTDIKSIHSMYNSNFWKIPSVVDDIVLCLSA